MNVIRTYAVSQQQAVQGFKNAGIDTPLIPPNTGPNTTGSTKTSKPIQSGVTNPVGGPTLFGILPSTNSGSNPASGCNNCDNDYLNPGNWACQIGKLSCEFTH